MKIYSNIPRILRACLSRSLKYPANPSEAHQCAFEEVKGLIQAHHDHSRVPLEYGPNAPPTWLTTDGSVSGIAGVISQGEDRKTARVAAFFSAKLSAAQANYPVHEIEMLAGVESTRRHRDILLGCFFTWVTDHKGLI